MKEVKFRGKRLTDEAWIYGYFFRNRGLSFIASDGIAENPLATWRDYNVDPETVDQYTGRKDNKGKEIYEGDYLKGLGDEIYAVWYSKELACYMVDLVVPDSQATDSLGCYDIEKYFEVIGNIHDNPELIKEK